MKRPLIKFSLFFTLLILLPGCYTVIWTPDEQFPTERDYEYQGYYPDYYYGDYYYFYDYPWWLTITPPDYAGEDNSGRERTREGSSNRNTDGGRSTDRGNTGGRNNGDIIQTDAPTRDRSSDDDNSGSTTIRSSNNDNSGSSTPRTETGRSTDSGNNSGSGSSRNNDGGRNSGGRR